MQHKFIYFTKFLAERRTVKHENENVRGVGEFLSIDNTDNSTVNIFWMQYKSENKWTKQQKHQKEIVETIYRNYHHSPEILKCLQMRSK